jgi:MFS family permease
MTILQNSAIIGMVLGNVLGSKLIVFNGKQNLSVLYYRFISIGILSVGLKFIPSLYTFMIGRLIHGFCGGVLNICF